MVVGADSSARLRRCLRLCSHQLPRTSPTDNSPMSPPTVMEDLYLGFGNATDQHVPTVSTLTTLGLSPSFILVPLILYLLLVALLRNHRLRQTLEQFPYTNRKSLSSMTNEDAFYIQQTLAELEFPFTFEKALQFALFRTYAIPSISKLLVQTGEFSEAATATKRYADTALLVVEFTGHHPQSERSIEAIGRMNYIHSQYQKSGKIMDDDMLYTLCLFACEPVRWIDQYEWRKLEEFEKCAIGTFWKAMGDAMGISYEKLAGGGEDGQGWRDGLEWLEDITRWGQAYEEKCMVPDENNRRTAEQTIAILLWGVPKMLKPYGRMVISALMDDRLRTAMMFVSSSLIVVAAMLMVHIAVSRNRPKVIPPSFLLLSPSANLSFATSPFHDRTSCEATSSPKSHRKAAGTS